MTVPFTKYEAAYLLSAYLEGERSGIPRNAIAKGCSIALRQMAINQGQRIDNTYRTAKGLISRVMSIESAYKGRTIIQPATHLFAEIVEMYRNDRESYNKILEKAKHMAEDTTEVQLPVLVSAHRVVDDTLECNQMDRAAFFEWLSVEQHMAEATCRGYVSAVHRAEMYAREHGVTSKRLYTSNLQEATAAATALFQDPGFCQYNAKQHNSFTAAIKKWLTFLSSDRASDGAESVSASRCDNHIISEKLLLSIQQYYGNGMRFDETVLRLLEERSGTKIDEKIKKILQSNMFCRSDGLHFLPEMVGSKKQLALLDRRALLEKIANFGCVDLRALYSDFCNYGTKACLRNEDDLADYLLFGLSKDIRIATVLGTKIIRKIGISTNETLEETVAKVVCAIKEAGCVTQDDLLLLFPAFSEQFLRGLLEKCTDGIIPAQINDFLCYQTIESLGLESDFSSMLNDILEEMDKLSLSPSQEIVHAMLSVKLGYNLMDEFNIPDGKTFRRIISTYYTGNRPRVWRAGCFGDVNLS